MKTNDVRPAKARVVVSLGESVRIIRELQGLTQSELARRTKISQSTISAIENDTINLGVERAKTLARVLKCHPAVLVFSRLERHQTIGNVATSRKSRIHSPSSNHSTLFVEASHTTPPSKSRGGGK